MDPQQQQAFNQFAGMGMGIIAFFMLFVFAILAFMVFLVWRIFTKAGLAGPLSLLIFVPGVGGIIVLCILAFSEWKVVPAPGLYNAMTPPYPAPGSFPSATPPSYPPSGYPPQGPTS